MNLKKINEFFGISLLIIGILKIMLMIFIFIQSSAAAVATVTEGKTKLVDASFFSDTLGIIQIVFAIASIVMVFINIKKFPNAALGYFIGILALGLEIILPAIVFFIYGFVEGSLYIIASNKIRDKEFKLFSINNDTAPKVESTDWFYNDKK